MGLPFGNNIDDKAQATQKDLGLFLIGRSSELKNQMRIDDIGRSLSIFYRVNRWILVEAHFDIVKQYCL